MAVTTSARLDLGDARQVIIRSVDTHEPWHWLTQGWDDLKRCPGTSIGYGVVCVALSLLLVAGLWHYQLSAWLLPLLAGFMLMGPLVAVGTYDMSRQLSQGERPSLRRALGAWRDNAVQIGLMGVFLMIFLLAWIRLATLLFALFFGTHPPLESGLLYPQLFTTGAGIGLLVAGTVVGAVLAFTAFSLSVIAVPRLLDRPEVGALEATVISLAVVKANFRAMLVWGFILTLVTAVGLALGLIGLAITLPLLGHASWRAYQTLVVDDEPR